MHGQLFVGGIDYDPGPYNITIPAGVTNLTFSISVTTDGIVEVNEEFQLLFNGSSLPYMVNTTEPTTVIIVDNDSKLMRVLT